MSGNLHVNVTVICLPTEHQRALEARFKGDRAFQVELEREIFHVKFSDDSLMIEGNCSGSVKPYY